MLRYDPTSTLNQVNKTKSKWGLKRRHKGQSLVVKTVRKKWWIKWVKCSSIFTAVHSLSWLPLPLYSSYLMANVFLPFIFSSYSYAFIYTACCIHKIYLRIVWYFSGHIFSQNRFSTHSHKDKKCLHFQFILTKENLNKMKAWFWFSIKKIEHEREMQFYFIPFFHISLYDRIFFDMKEQGLGL